MSSQLHVQIGITVNRKTMSVLFLHGLESGPQGKKAEYLRKHFDKVIVPRLETGIFTFSPNSFLSGFIRNIDAIFSGEYYHRICMDILNRATELAVQSINEHNPSVIVASSMGGAIALEARRRGSIQCPVVILAPGLKRVLWSGDPPESSQAEIRVRDWYSSFRENNKENASKVVVVHSVKDSVVNIADSEELVREIGAQLISVPDDTHSLNTYLLDAEIHADANNRTPEDKLQQLVKDLL